VRLPQQDFGQHLHQLMSAALLAACAGLSLMAAGMAAVGVIASRGAGGSPRHGEPSPASASDEKEAETRRLMADGSADSSHAPECEHGPSTQS
jgi:hypothetical protein